MPRSGFTFDLRILSIYIFNYLKVVPIVSKNYTVLDFQSFSPCFIWIKWDTGSIKTYIHPGSNMLLKWRRLVRIEFERTYSLQQISTLKHSIMVSSPLRIDLAWKNRKPYHMIVKGIDSYNNMACLKINISNIDVDRDRIIVRQYLISQEWRQGY